MLKQVVFLGAILLFIGESSCQRFILPTYRPPPRKPVIIRTIREAVDDEPLWLHKGDNIDRAPATGDHPYLPSIIDDVKIDPNQRYARSLDSPSAKRGGGSHTTSSGSRNTGATHPGYNRRNAREIRLPFDIQDTINIPRPHYPIDPFPRLQRPNPIYARVARSAQFPGQKRPTIIVPGWNPNAPVKPWQKIRF